MSNFPLRAVITKMIGIHPVRIQIERKDGITRLIDGKVFFDKTMKYWSTFVVNVISTSTMNTYNAACSAGKGHEESHDIDAVPCDLKPLYKDLNNSAHKLSTRLSEQLYFTVLEAFNNGGSQFKGLVVNALSMNNEDEVAEILNLCPDEFIDPEAAENIVWEIMNAPMCQGLDKSIGAFSLAFRIGLYKLFSHVEGFDAGPVDSEEQLTNRLVYFLSQSS